jgi:PAS domain-containing protein
LRVLQKGTLLSNQQDVFVRKDGTCFDVVYSAMPIRAGEEIAGLVVVFRDVTEEKRAEQALRDRDRALTMANDELIHQKSDLADANKELQSFSYSASHNRRVHPHRRRRPWPALELRGTALPRDRQEGRRSGR